MLTVNSINNNTVNYQPAFKAKNIEQIRSNLQAMEKAITIQDQEVIRIKAAKLNFGQKIVQFFRKLIGKQNVDNTSIQRLNNLQKLLLAKGIKSKINRGMLVIKSDYRSSIWGDNESITEGELFKYIKGFKKNANFEGSKAKTLGKVEYIKRDAIFTKSCIENTGDLKWIGRNATFDYSNIKEAGELECIGRSAFFRRCKNIRFPKLKRILGGANFMWSEGLFFGCLQYIGWADFCWAKINIPESLQRIERDIDIRDTTLSIKDFDKVDIGGCIYSGKI